MHACTEDEDGAKCKGTSECQRATGTLPVSGSKQRELQGDGGEEEWKDTSGLHGSLSFVRQLLFSPSEHGF